MAFGSCARSWWSACTVAGRATARATSRTSGSRTSKRPVTDASPSVVDREADPEAATPGRSALSASVVVCVYTEERWDLIKTGLASLREQRVAPDEVVVVVDHNEVLATRL